MQGPDSVAETCNFYFSFSSRLGRRIIIRVTLSVLLVAGFSTLLSQSFITFIALRYFVSLGVSGACATAFVLCKHLDHFLLDLERSLILTPTGRSISEMRL